MDIPLSDGVLLASLPVLVALVRRDIVDEK